MTTHPTQLICCTRCTREQLPEAFHINRTRPSGHAGICKTCKSGIDATTRERARLRAVGGLRAGARAVRKVAPVANAATPAAAAQLIRCPNCTCVLPRTAFYNNSKRSSGRNPHCKECQDTAQQFLRERRARASKPAVMPAEDTATLVLDTAPAQTTYQGIW